MHTSFYSNFTQLAKYFIPVLTSLLCSIHSTKAVSLRQETWDFILQDANESDSLDTDSERNDVVQILLYVQIPIVSGIVGFVTNWIALKMTFYPTEFAGVKLLGKYSRCENQPGGCIGWQGIVPTKVAKIAGMSVDLMTTKLFDVKEIFSRIEKEKAAESLREGFEVALSEIIETISDKFIIAKETEWKGVRNAVKIRITQTTLQALPSFTENFMQDLIENLDDVYDLRDMCVTEMTNNKQLLNDIFESVGRKELVFIRNSGFYFGVPFGLVQLGIWYVREIPIILPLFGLIVGIATNYIALKLIFNPVEPWYIKMPWKTYKVQGLFLQRQGAASKMFARRVVNTILHSENIWRYMLEGPKSEEFKKLLDVHVEKLSEDMLGIARPLVLGYLGEENFGQLKGLIRDFGRNKIAEIINYMHVYTDEALDLENEIGVKMAALPAKDFERVLHPAFEEDEWLLILTGGILGALAGLFQLFVVFGEGF